MPGPDDEPSTITLLLHLAHFFFWTRGSYKRVQQPVTGRLRAILAASGYERERERARETERERERGGGLVEGAGLAIQSPAAKSYRLQGWFMRWRGLIEGDRAIISPGQPPSGSLMERWRWESRCKLTTKYFLCWPEPPPGCGHVPHLSTPWLPSQRESNLAEAQRTTGERRHVLSPSLPLSAPFLMYFFLQSSPPQGVIPHPHGLLYPTPLSTFSFYFLPFFSPCKFSLFQENNKVNRQGCGQRRVNKVRDGMKACKLKWWQSREDKKIVTNKNLFHYVLVRVEKYVLYGGMTEGFTKKRKIRKCLYELLHEIMY